MVEQELYRASIHVTALAGNLDGQIANVFPLLLTQLWRWCHFDQFLVTALDGTVTFVQVHHIAMVVGENLHLDVTGFNDALLQKNLGTAKGLGGLGNHPLVVLPQLFLIIATTNAPATTTGRGFEHNRVANVLRLAHGIFDVIQVAFRTRCNGNTSSNRGLAGLGLVAHRTDRLG